MLDDNVPPDNLKELASVPFPVFYMNYNLTPVQNPWRDPIGNVVKHLRGYEYTITRPRDLWTSWSDIMSRIVKLKLVTTVGNVFPIDMKRSFGGWLTLPVLALVLSGGRGRRRWRSGLPIAIRWLRFTPRRKRSWTRC